MAGNISSVKTKLENSTLQKLSLQCDVMSLNEAKMQMSVCLPRFVTFRFVNSASSHRGGTVVMVKNYLAHYVINVGYSIDDQVWMKLKRTPMVMFGLCYIPPHD